MNIGIIDAELLTRSNHRFPNLASMKIAGYHINKGDNVTLLTDYNSIEDYDTVYISKVFTKTPVPFWITESIKNGDARIKAGGTGFYFDKAAPLPDDIEHTKPYYKLYSSFIEKQGNNTSSAFKFYKNYSIGFLTRHCFRHCPFCVNQHYNRVIAHSPLKEFLDEQRRKICLCDDNFLGFGGWRKLLDELRDTARPFVFRQGLDERLINEEKAKLLFSSKYDGDFIFAFDSIKDYELIKDKLQIINKYRPKNDIKFYVLTGFESTDLTDIENTLTRIELLLLNGCTPYVMKYRSASAEPWRSSKYSGFYTTLARWANNSTLIHKLSLREFTELDARGGGKVSTKA